MIAGFRASLPDLDRAGSYYDKVAELENQLKSLGISGNDIFFTFLTCTDHPSVKGALEGILGTQSQMEEILQDISVRQSQALEEQMEQVTQLLLQA